MNCPKCGKEIDDKAEICTECGAIIKNKPSNIWYLLPFVGSIIGGIIGYIVLKNRDKSMADNMVIIGMMSFVASIILMLIGNKIVSEYEMLLILFAISIIGILLGFIVTDVTNSIIEGITNWCIRKNEGYEEKDISRFSIDYIFKIACSTIIRSSKFVDKIENPNLRTGLKLNVIYIIILLTIVSVIAVMYIVIMIVAAILALAIFLIGFYILYKLAQLWYRHEKGIPLFPDKDQENPIFKTKKVEDTFDDNVKWLKDERGNKIGELHRDRIFDDNIQTIKDKDGKIVGEVDSNYFIFDQDTQAIKDEHGNLTGTIDPFIFDKDKRLIKKK